MYMKRTYISMMMLICCTAALWASTPLPEKELLDRHFSALSQAHLTEAQESINAIDQLLRERGTDAELRAYIESKCVEVLQAEMTVTAKKYCCRRLSVYGSEACVPIVATLLTDAELSHMARYVLERIGGPPAVEALLAALAPTQGDLRVAIIHSLGELRAPSATTTLIALANDENLPVRRAAITSLGKIGGKEAADFVIEHHAGWSRQDALRTAAYDAYLSIAAHGDSATALRIYEDVYRHAAEDYLKVAGFAGLISIVGPHQRDYLTAALKQDGGEILNTAGAFLAEDADAATFAHMARAFPQYSAAGQVSILDALAQRNHADAKKQVIAAVGSTNPQVCRTALVTLGVLGSAEDVPLIAAHLTGAHRSSATQSLKMLTGSGVDDAIVTEIGNADDSLIAELITILHAREARDKLGVVEEYLDSDHRALRRSALQMVESYGTAEHLQIVLDLLQRSTAGKQRDYVKTMRQLARRYPGESGAMVLAAYQHGSDGLRPTLLKLLVHTGYSDKLQVIRQAALTPKTKLRDTAIRLINNWDTAEVLDDLYAMMTQSDNATYQILAFRNYVRLLKQSDHAEAGRFAKLLGAYSHAQRDDEKVLVISGMSAMTTLDALDFVTLLLEEESLASAASRAVLTLAQVLKSTHYEQVRDAVEQVIAVDAATALTAEATALIETMERFKGALLQEWSFNTDVGGWSGNEYCEISAAGGHLVLTITGHDPFITVPVDLPGGKLKVQMRVNTGPTETWQAFWGSENKHVYQAPFWLVSYDVPDTQGKWLDHTFELDSDARLNLLRLDPGTGVEQIKIDAIYVLRTDETVDDFSQAFRSNAATRILLIGTPLDHPYGTHVYLHECGILEKCLDQVPGVDAVVSQGWPGDPALLEDLDAIALYASPGAEILLTGPAAEQFPKLMAQGVGLSALHWSTGIGDAANTDLEAAYAGYLGGIFSFAFSGLEMAQVRIHQLERNHPVCYGWNEYDQLDEIYLRIKLLPEAIPLLKATWAQAEQVVAWSYQRPDGGRSYGNTLGHFHHSFWTTAFRRGLVNGILWTAHHDVPQSGAQCLIGQEDIMLDLLPLR